MKANILKKGYRYKQIKTGRLLLVKPDMKYLDEYFDNLSDKRMWKYDSLRIKLTRPGIKKWLERRILANKKKNEYSFFILCNDKLVGTIMTNCLNRSPRSCDISYEVSCKYWGNGYATEALSAFVDWVFKNTKLRRIIASVVAENLASVKVLEKNHFVREGVLRESAMHNNKIYDDYVYGLLKKEYLARK